MRKMVTVVKVVICAMYHGKGNGQAFLELETFEGMAVCRVV